MPPKTRPHHQGNQLKFKKDENQDELMTIAPKDLTIVWGGDARYWNLPENDEPAELYQVSWLEVTGCVFGTYPEKDYEVGFTLTLNPDAFGWGSAPVFIMAKRGKKGKFSASKYLLDTGKEMKVTLKGKQVSGDWDDHDVYFGLYEVWSGKWKGGMKIHTAFIRELP